MNRNNRIAGVSASRDRLARPKDTGITSEVEAIVKQQLDNFKQAYDEEAKSESRRSL